MNPFLIVINEPIKIKLTDNEYLEESAYIIITPSDRGKGFDIQVKDMTDRVSCKIGDYYAGSF